MEVKNDYKPSFVIMCTDVQYLYSKGEDFRNASLELPKHLAAKTLLSTVALELFGKSILASNLCLKNKSDTKESLKSKINKEFKNVGHCLDSLFQSIPEDRRLLEIKCVERVNYTGFVDEYRFLIGKNENEQLLSFKTLEAARYGSFAGKEDIITSANQTNEEAFLKRLSESAREKIYLTQENLKTVVK